MQTINQVQIKLLHVAIKQLGIDDTVYRMMLRERFQVNSCKDLSYVQADSFINEMVRFGFKIHSNPKPKRPKSSNVEYLPSAGEMSLINHLRKDILWRQPHGFYAWVKKMLGRDHIRTSREAGRIIEGLKNMRRQQQQKQAKKWSASGVT